MRKYNKIRTHRKAKVNHEMQNEVKRLISKLQKGQCATVEVGKELYRTTIDQINDSCLYLELRGRMECINVTDIITGRYKVLKV